MKSRQPLKETETTLLNCKAAHEALAAAAAEKLRKIRAAEESLARVRALSEGACPLKPPLPKPIPLLQPTRFNLPYENAA